MLNRISSLIAWRYLWHKEKDSNIAVMTKICFAGILIGTFALMLTLIITNGFEKVIHEKMRGINAQIIIYAQGNKLDFGSIAHALHKDFDPELAGISGNSIKQVILDHDKRQSVLFLKGIYPDREGNVTTLGDKIIRPAPNPSRRNLPVAPQDKRDLLCARGEELRSSVSNHSSEKTNILPQLLTPNNIIIGYKTALEHNLHIGQEITLLIPEPSGRKRLALKSRTVTIAGIFKVGLEEYDNNLAFMSLETLNELFDEQGVDMLTIKLKHNSDSAEKIMIEKLKQRLPHLTVQSWKDQYPALVASLKLEKYVMFFILALITLVACMNMISLLFMQIQHKRRDIAIFKAMGLADGVIRSIFLHMGLAITISASLIGLGFAALAGYFLERYPFIQLPDVYYVSYLPARMDAEIFAVVFIATLVLGFFATWIPAHRASQIIIAQILRQE